MQWCKVRRVMVYTVGCIATIATSPLDKYFGTTAFDQLTTGLSTDVTHIPIQATVEFVNPEEADPFHYCGWNVVVDLSEPISSGTEVVLWGLTSPWDQGSFDVAYANALASQPDEPEQQDTAVIEGADTGSDTGSFDTGISDTAFSSDAVGSYEGFNLEHQVFYETMRDLVGDEYAYRIRDSGTISGPLFDPYSSIVAYNSVRILYYSECGNTTNHFVLTVMGEPTSVDATVTMVAHQGATVAQPMGCGPKPEAPDYTNVRMQVVVE